MEAIDYPKEYDNSGRVANSGELLRKYAQDAAAYRDTLGDDLEAHLAYGPKPRNRLDIVWPDGGDRTVPIVVFIHGGYWQRMDRADFTHMARGLRDRGLAVALPSYTLAPEASVGEIINEMRRACLLLYQTHKRKLVVVGHSAGGHLAACMLATDWERIHPDLPDDLIIAGMGISGLYDLLPIIRTPVNDALRMDERAAHAASPVHWVPEALKRFEAWVGEEESSEYHRQSRDLASRWSMLGTPTAYESVGGANHFTVIDALTDSESKMIDRIVGLVFDSSTSTTDSDGEQPEDAAPQTESEAEASEETKAEEQTDQKTKTSDEEKVADAEDEPKTDDLKEDEKDSTDEEVHTESEDGAESEDGTETEANGTVIASTDDQKSGDGDDGATDNVEKQAPGPSNDAPAEETDKNSDDKQPEAKDSPK